MWEQKREQVVLGSRPPLRRSDARAEAEDVVRPAAAHRTRARAAAGRGATIRSGAQVVEEDAEVKPLAPEAAGSKEIGQPAAGARTARGARMWTGPPTRRSDRRGLTTTGRARSGRPKVEAGARRSRVSIPARQTATPTGTTTRGSRRAGTRGRLRREADGAREAQRNSEATSAVVVLPTRASQSIMHPA